MAGVDELASFGFAIDRYTLSRGIGAWIRGRYCLFCFQQLPLSPAMLALLIGLSLRTWQLRGQRGGLQEVRLWSISTYSLA